MRYTRIFIVRWADCDVNGHMRNTSYSEYTIDVRMSYLTEHGYPYERFQELGIGPVVLREELDYLRELKLGDTVEADFTQVGMSPDGARCKLAHDFWRPGGKEVARVVLLLAWMDMKTRRLTHPPEDLLRVMTAVPKGEGWEELPPLKRDRP